MKLPLRLREPEVAAEDEGGRAEGGDEEAIHHRWRLGLLEMLLREGEDGEGGRARTVAALALASMGIGSPQCLPLEMRALWRG